MDELDVESKYWIDANEPDVNSNLEHTITETLQRKWDVMIENTSKKLNTPNSIYNSNYDLNENTLNGFQSSENRNSVAPRDLDIDAGGAAALDVLQSLQNDEKSISIKNHSGNARRNRCWTTYEFSQACRSGGGESNTSNTLSSSVQPMKTQCESNCECCTP